MSCTSTAPHAPAATLADQLDVLADRVVVAARHDGTDLSDLASVLRSTDRLTAAAVVGLMATTRSGMVAEHGITTGSWLRAVAGRTSADAGMLLAAVERLTDMPAVTAWFADGTLTWAAVRGIVAATRVLTVDQRRWVDATLAHDADRVARSDADQIVAEVARLADVARPELHRDRAARSFDRQFLALQPALDGTSQLYGELDAETTAIALEALATTRTHDHTEADDGGNHTESDAPGDDATDDDDGANRGEDKGTSRCGRGQGRNNLEAFKALCHLRLRSRQPTSSMTDITDGRGDSDRDGGFAADRGSAARGDERWWAAVPSTARPSMLVITDLALLAGDTTGGVGSVAAQLLWRTDRMPVQLTAEAAQRLACDATLRHVLVDGAGVLGVGATHPKVSAKLRSALEVRDGGCRFTACRRPVQVCENHHVIPVLRGGLTVLANLALLCMGHHHAVHEGRWQATLDADTGVMTFTRRGVTITSLPRGDRRLRPSRPPPRGRPTRRMPTHGHEPPPPPTDHRPNADDLPF